MCKAKFDTNLLRNKLFREGGGVQVVADIYSKYKAILLKVVKMKWTNRKNYFPVPLQVSGWV